MPSLKKVFLRGNKKDEELTLKEQKQLEKKHQKEYQEKVVKLSNCLINFREDLKKMSDLDTKKIQNSFKTHLDKYINSHKKFSRTNDIIKKMYKNLCKIEGDKLFKGSSYSELVGDRIFITKSYEECFSFEAKKSKDGYIKRSAIDNPEIVDLFTKIKAMIKVIISKKVIEKFENVHKEAYNKKVKKLCSAAKNCLESLGQNKYGVSFWSISISFCAAFREEYLQSLSLSEKAIFAKMCKDIKDFEKNKNKKELSLHTKYLTLKDIKDYMYCFEFKAPTGDSYAINDPEFLKLFESIKNKIEKLLKDEHTDLINKIRKNELIIKIDSKLDELEIIGGLVEPKEYAEVSRDMVERNVEKVKVECRNPVIIDEKPFQKFNNLKEIWFTQGIKEVRKDAFKGCKNLKEIHVPKSCSVKELEKLEEIIRKQCGNSQLEIIGDK